MTTENDDHSTAASDQPATTRSLTWMTATIVSVLLGLASAGLMTAAMFWIGNYYRGTQLSQDENGRQKLEELRSAEQNELENYGWINRTDGVVRIPVERAMQLLVDEAQRQETSPTNPPTDEPASR